MAVSRPALGQDPAGSDVQGGEEGGGPVADVAVRDALDVAQPQGQEGLGALQGMALALLVDAQDQGMVGRIKVEADDVADLLGEEGVGGELEVLLPVGLEVERGPEALDRGLGDPGGLGHGTAVDVSLEEVIHSLQVETTAAIQASRVDRRASDMLGRVLRDTRHEVARSLDLTRRRGPERDHGPIC